MDIFNGVINQEDNKDIDSEDVIENDEYEADTKDLAKVKYIITFNPSYLLF